MGKIEIKNTDLYYGDFHALKNINLDIPANQIGEFEKELFSFVDSVYSDIPESIRTTGKLEDDVKEKLTKAIEECKSKFLSEH